MDQYAFEQIKAFSASISVQRRLSSKHQFVINIDASVTGFGVMLTHDIDGEERVLSRESNSAVQCILSVIECECLAVV